MHFYMISSNESHRPPPVFGSPAAAQEERLDVFIPLQTSTLPPACMHRPVGAPPGDLAAAAAERCKGGDVLIRERKPDPFWERRQRHDSDKRLKLHFLDASAEFLH